MGGIRAEVREDHLNVFPEEEEILKPFLDGFFVTWGRRRTAYNTEVSVYFLNPEPFISESFGFDREILLVYSPYKRIEARTIQAAESFLMDSPAKGRIEQLNYFLITEDDNAKEWLQSYLSDNQESRIIIIFSASELRESSKGDSWYIRNVISQQLFGRDLFDYRLPLQKDTYFFGRQDMVMDYYDAIKRGENRGIFGLRKTGKTSLIFKLERMFKIDGIICLFYYDCKLPSIRRLRWFQLLEKVCKDICERFDIKIKGRYDEINIADTFDRLVSKTSGLDKKIVIVFDEIEWVSPMAVRDLHWKSDFVDFWQTFWACQSRNRNISAIIAGVNPSVVEIDSFDGIQNPLFGIAPYNFLQGFSLEELSTMVNVLGKRMGMKFDSSSKEYLHKRYGGHPLLTRIGCSLINSRLKANGEIKPVDITKLWLTENEEDRDAELVFYCRHVVSEMQQFYPEEYEMLSLLASGQISDFLELATYPEYTRHLKSYGLLGQDEKGSPVIAIPVVKRYIGLELARKDGRRTIYKLVEPTRRKDWLEKRVQSVLREIRFLERLIQKLGTPILFGTNSFPEADKFASIELCQSAGDFVTFINVCYRCFVESIDNYGKSIGKPDYFWKDFKNFYPGLWYALQRIRLYRHDFFHLELKSNVNSSLLEYLEVDLEGNAPSKVNDLHFWLQQCVLDGLLTGIQIESQRLA